MVSIRAAPDNQVPIHAHFSLPGKGLQERAGPSYTVHWSSAEHYTGQPGKQKLLYELRFQEEHKAERGFGTEIRKEREKGTLSLKLLLYPRDCFAKVRARA